MMREAREEEVGSYLRDRYQRARMLLAGVEQRQNLLLRLTALLLENQSEFFRGGRLRPFTMAEAAGILSVSPSTVTRAVKNKWIQWPEGSLPMKKLFTAGLDERGEISAFQVKEVLDALIRVEDPQKPYNDGQLAAAAEPPGHCCFPENGGQIPHGDGNSVLPWEENVRLNGL